MEREGEEGGEREGEGQGGREVAGRERVTPFENPSTALRM